MKFNELHKSSKAKTKTRAGRGISAGRGKTAGRGTKGQGSRKSGGVRPGFEGGQTPLHMRLPKLRGFKSLRLKPKLVNTSQINKLKKSVVDNSVLHKAGLVDSSTSKVKLLYDDEVTLPVKVKLQGASQAAIKSLAKAGGSFDIMSIQDLPKPKKASDEK